MLGKDLVWDGENYISCVSEGAHVNFGPRNNTEIGLLNHIKKSHKHVTYELVCSGIGIPRIYDFLLTCSKQDEPDWFLDLLQ